MSDKKEERMAFAAGFIAGSATAAVCIMASAFVAFAIIGLIQ